MFNSSSSLVENPADLVFGVLRDQFPFTALTVGAGSVCCRISNFAGSQLDLGQLSEWLA